MKAIYTVLMYSIKIYPVSDTYLWCQMTGPDGIIVAHPLMEVRVFTSPYVILMPFVVRVLIEDPITTFYPDGVTAVEIRGHVGTIRAAFIAAALEIPVFIEENLSKYKVR